LSARVLDFFDNTIDRCAIEAGTLSAEITVVGVSDIESKSYSVKRAFFKKQVEVIVRNLALNIKNVYAIIVAAFPRLR
jgi:hypothetical protein